MLQLGDAPPAAAPHLVADWVELTAAADSDARFSAARFITARRHGDQLMPGKAGTDDARFADAEDVWRLLLRRAAEFGEAYPFEVRSGEAPALAVRARSGIRDAYLMCLCSSRLDAVDPSERKVLTEAFERTTQHVVEACLPAGSTVHVFGNAGSDYTGNIATKVATLAANLGAVVLPGTESMSPYSSGDGGLDVVGWANLGDRLHRVMVWFVQCACGKDWPAKWSEVDPKVWEKRLSMVSQLLPATAIPYDFRDAQGDWEKEDDIVVGLLIDRSRYLYLLAQGTDQFGDVPVQWLLDRLPGLASA